MAFPLEQLADCLRRGEAPPFDWIVEHVADGTIAPVWKHNDSPLAMFDVLLALDPSLRRPRRAFEAALREGFRVAGQVLPKDAKALRDILNRLSDTDESRLAEDIHAFAGRSLRRTKQTDDRSRVLALGGFGNWLESKSYTFVRFAFRNLQSIHGISNAIARAVPAPRIAEILAAVKR